MHDGACIKQDVLKIRSAMSYSLVYCDSLVFLSLVEETGVSGENHRPAVSHSQTLSHHTVSSTLLNKNSYLVHTGYLERNIKSWPSFLCRG
jgi:hypothetical protein